MTRLENIQKLKKELYIYKKFLLNVILLNSLEEKDSSKKLIK